MKIIDKIDERVKQNDIPFYSFEYFPPRTQQGWENLLQRVQRMVKNLGPLFIDITWGAGGSTSDSTLELANHFVKYSGTDVMMHLTCTNMTKELLDYALEKAKECGVENILALRGDPPRGQERWEAIEGGFQYASDLVRYIKEKYGDYFCIGVAGYSDGHPDCEDRITDIGYLKTKVDAGADFVVTQLFYDADQFLDYVRRVRALGINVPIIPGIMPLQTYGGWLRMVTTCKVQVPQWVYDDLEPIKHDDDAVKEYGIKLCVDLCQKLFDNGILGAHIYTLNLEKSAWRILEDLNIVKPLRDMPWRPSATRKEEEIRPIHWNLRPQSYIDRTATWDEYPNGRWGDARSPAYGNVYPYGKHKRDEKELERLRGIWGIPESQADAKQMFLRYWNKEIREFPWFEEVLDPEDQSLDELLKEMISNNLLPISTQAPLNGLKSDDPKGWGPPNGYVYQKAFFEFFVPSTSVEKIEAVLSKYPGIAYQMGNNAGELKRNFSENTVIALAWGVFPNREIQQPTVLDSESFLAWKDEAFAVMVNDWAGIYDQESQSKQVLQEIHDDYYLVNIVDNDFISENFREMFREVFESLQSS